MTVNGTGLVAEEEEEDGYFTCAVSVQHKEHKVETSSSYSATCDSEQLGRKVVWPLMSNSIKQSVEDTKIKNTSTGIDNNWIQQKTTDNQMTSSRLSRSNSRSKNIMDRARSFERGETNIRSRPGSRVSNRPRSPSGTRGEDNSWQTQMERPGSRTDVDSMRFGEIGRVSTGTWEERIKHGSSFENLPTMTPPPKRRELGTKRATADEQVTVVTKKAPAPPVRSTYPPVKIESQCLPPSLDSTDSKGLSEESLGQLVDENKESIVQQWVESTNQSVENVDRELEKFAYDIAENVVTNMEKNTEKKISNCSGVNFSTPGSSGVYFAAPVRTSQRELHGPVYVQEENRRGGLTFQQEERRREEFRKEEEVRQEERRRLQSESEARKLQEQMEAIEVHEEQQKRKAQQEKVIQIETLRRQEEEKRHHETLMGAEVERKLQEDQALYLLQEQRLEEDRKQQEIHRFEKLKQEEEAKRLEEIRLEQEMRKQYEIKQKAIREQKEAEEIARKQEQLQSEERAKREEQARREEQIMREEEARRQEHAMREEQALKQEQAMREEYVRREEQAMREEQALKQEQAKREEQARREEQVRKEEQAMIEEQVMRVEQARLEECARLEEKARCEEKARLLEIVKREEQARLEERTRVPTQKSIKTKSFDHSQDQIHQTSKYEDHLGCVKTGQVDEKRSFWSRSTSESQINQTGLNPAPRRKRVDFSGTRQDDSRPGSSLGQAVDLGAVKNMSNVFLSKSKSSAAVMQEDQTRGRSKQRVLHNNGWAKINQSEQSRHEFTSVKTNKVNETATSWGQRDTSTSSRSTPIPSRNIGEVFDENKVAKHAEQESSANSWRTKTPEPTLRLVNVTVEKAVGSNQNIHISENAQAQMANYKQEYKVTSTTQEETTDARVISNDSSNTMASQCLVNSQTQTLSTSSVGESKIPPQAPERNQSYGGKCQTSVPLSGNGYQTPLNNIGPLTQIDPINQVKTPLLPSKQDQIQQAPISNTIQNSLSTHSINSVLSTSSSSALPVPVKQEWFQDDANSTSSILHPGILSPTQTGKTPLPVVANWFDKSYVITDKLTTNEFENSSSLDSDKYINICENEVETCQKETKSMLNEMFDELVSEQQTIEIIESSVETGKIKRKSTENTSSNLNDNLDSCSVKSEVIMKEKEDLNLLNEKNDLAPLIPPSPREVRKCFQPQENVEKSCTKSADIELCSEIIMKEKEDLDILNEKNDLVSLIPQSPREVRKCFQPASNVDKSFTKSADIELSSEVIMKENKDLDLLNEKSDLVSLIPQSPREVRKCFQPASNFEKSFTKSADLELSSEFKDGIKGKVKESTDAFLKKAVEDENKKDIQSKANQIEEIKCQRMISIKNNYYDDNIRKEREMKQEKLQEIDDIRKSRALSSTIEDCSTLQSSYAQEKHERELELLQVAKRSVNADPSFGSTTRDLQLREERNKELALLTFRTKEPLVNIDDKNEYMTEDRDQELSRKNEGIFETSQEKLALLKEERRKELEEIANRKVEMDWSCDSKEKTIREEKARELEEISNNRIKAKTWEEAETRKVDHLHNERAEELRQISEIRSKYNSETNLSENTNIQSKNIDDELLADLSGVQSRVKDTAAVWKQREKSGSQDLDPNIPLVKEVPSRRIGSLFRNDPDYWKLSEPEPELPQPPPPTELFELTTNSNPPPPPRQSSKNKMEEYNKEPGLSAPWRKS